ncbi:MAG: urease accessory protein [Snowella sp.]|jgi:urease accessory protein|nr:MAG: urease accessory protein [Snowella sp.]
MTSSTSLSISSQSKHWTGKLDLNYSHQDGTTKLSQALAQAPLKIQRAFYPEGPELCHSVILHTAGGIVGGDRLVQNIELEAHSQVLLTTAAATKVYRSEGERSEQIITIKLGENAYLEWFPQETVIFNQAIYQQDLRVELAKNAVFCGWEITRLGRTARGEQFLTGDWRSRIEIWQAGYPLWIDRQGLQGNLEIINSPNGLNQKAIVATFIWLGHNVGQEVVTEARELGKSWVKEGEIGITQTQGEGLLCRYRGNSTTEVKHYFEAIWGLLCQSYRDRPAIHPRVWIP